MELFRSEKRIGGDLHRLWHRVHDRLPAPLTASLVRAGLAVMVAGALALIAAAMAVTLVQVPSISRVFLPPSEASHIYAGNGELIASLFRENREFVPLSEIPLALQQAVVAVEDERFFQHSGIDPRALARAGWRNLRAGRFVEGGSTITQQLARRVFLTSRRTVSRKVAEMVLALEVERRLSKREILERYLNEVYFGQGAYGVELAAQVYFGKRARNLTLPESAILAGVIRAPSVLSPFRNFALAKERQLLVLRRMAELGYISAQTAHQTAAQPVRLTRETNAGLVGVRAPSFISYVLPYLLERYGPDLVYNGGLRVYTTLDPSMQIAAERLLREGIDQARSQGLHVGQGALVAMDARTGFILAMIGGYGYRQGEFNRVWQARRQPGSAFKPFVYTAAVERGWRAWNVVVDAPMSYRLSGARVWQPRNYDNQFRGDVTVQQALEQSINIPAIRTLNEVGPARVVEVAHRMGIASPLQPNLSLALGSSEVTPLELATAFGTLATMGLRTTPLAVTRVVDRTGKVLESNLPRPQPALSPDVAYRMIDMLKGVILRGTGRAAWIGRPAAGKTGTSDDYRNAWFIGFTPRIVAAVWVGNDDNTPMNKVVGGMVPARIWGAFMRQATRHLPAEDWQRPAGVEAETPPPPQAAAPQPDYAAIVRQVILKRLHDQQDPGGPAR